MAHLSLPELRNTRQHFSAELGAVLNSSIASKRLEKVKIVEHLASDEDSC